MCTINPVVGDLLIDVSFWVRQFVAFRQSPSSTGNTVLSKKVVSNDNITGAFFQIFRVFDTEINSARRSAAQKIGAGDVCVSATCSAPETQPMERAKRGGFVKYVEERRSNVRSLKKK